MSAVVNLFAYVGVSHAFVANYAQQQAFHAMTLLKQPYLARQSMTADTGAAQTSGLALSPEHTKLLHVQVEPGKRIRYEVTPKGYDARIADTASPVLEGTEPIEFGPGWTISIIEAA